jgi:hypothetical protein
MVIVLFIVMVTVIVAVTAVDDRGVVVSAPLLRETI